jgi:hypothetical protein
MIFNAARTLREYTLQYENITDDITMAECQDGTAATFEDVDPPDHTAGEFYSIFLNDIRRQTYVRCMHFFACWH